jgi:hypothetical protein
MTVEADIFTALKGLVSNRVYPDLNDAQTVTTPYIVYQEISGEVVNFMEAAVASKKNGRFQIACWATTRAASKALALQVESAMVLASTFQAKPIGGQTSVYDEDTKLRGTRQDFSVWSTR